MIYTTRKEHFNAAHKLYNPNWSEAKNTAVFGKCSNANWHGHNYNLYVTVKGKINPDTGYSANLKEISLIIRKYVIEALDHKNLNVDVPFLKGLMPSTENVAIAIWQQLAPHIQQLDCTLHCVKLYETDNNYVEYFGE